jgi:NAD(P)-dependent dehydrogenase (short-subunit alcohol dehydrogenase family)
MGSFSGKNILVVGGTSGIGLALARQLKAQDATVWVASRQPSEGSAGLAVTHVPLDVTGDVGSLTGALPEVLHGLAYCPGTINLKPFPRLTDDDFLRDLQVNVLGAVRVVRAVLPKLKKADNAGIVFFSTVAARVGMNFHTSVATAKGALEGLTVSLAAELAASRIRVNAVAPSLTDTPLAGNLLSTPEKRDAADKRHPLGRVGNPDDMAALAALLLSDQGSWLSGQVIHVDGGMSTLRSV